MQPADLSPTELESIERHARQLMETTLPNEGQGLYRLQQALELAEQVGDPLLLAEVNADLGLCLARAAASQQALEHLEEAERHLDGLDPSPTRNRLLVAVPRTLGIVYDALARYDDAERAHERCLDMATEFGDRRGEQAALANLGFIYSQQGRGGRSINFSVMAIEHPHQDRKLMAGSYGILGSTYEMQGHTDLALDAFQQAVELFGEYRHGRATAQLRMAIVHARRDEVDSALVLIKSSEELLLELDGADYELPILHIARAELAIARGRFDEARERCERFLDLVGLQGDTQEVIRGTLVLAQVKHRIGDHQGCVDELRSLDRDQMSYDCRQRQLGLLVDAHRALEDWQAAFLALEQRTAETYLPVADMEEAVRDAQRYLMLSDGLQESNLQLQRQRDELVRDRSALEDSVREIAHDIRSPVTVGLLCLDTGTAGSQDQMAERVDRLRQALKQVDRIADQFHQVSTEPDDDGDLQAGQGRTDQDRAHGDGAGVGLGAGVGVNVGDEVESAVQLYQVLAGKKNQQILYEPESQAGDLVVDFDRDALARVMANLLSNAVKYSPFDRITRVTVGAGEGERAVISVRDLGLGLSEDDLDALFVASRRVSNRPTHAESSTGVGLIAAKKLVEGGGGTLEGFSEGPGLGSTFRVTLPLLRADGQPA